MMPVSTASASVFIGSTRSLPQSWASAAANGSRRIVHERAAGEGDLAQLLGCRPEEGGMPVAEVQGGVGREEIEVTLPLDVGRPRTFGRCDREGQRSVVLRDRWLGVDGC